MQGTILFHCGGCNHIWPVPDELADRPAICPECGGASGSGGFVYTRLIEPEGPPVAPSSEE